MGKKPVKKEPPKARYSVTVTITSEVKSKYTKKSSSKKKRKSIAPKEIEELLTKEALTDSLTDIPLIKKNISAEDEQIGPHTSDTLDVDTEGVVELSVEPSTSETEGVTDILTYDKPDVNTDEFSGLLTSDTQDIDSEGPGQPQLSQKLPKSEQRKNFFLHPLEYSIQEPVDTESQQLSGTTDSHQLHDLVQNLIDDSNPLYQQDLSSDLDTVSSQVKEHTVVDMETTSDIPEDAQQWPSQDKDHMAVDMELTNEVPQDSTQLDTTSDEPQGLSQPYMTPENGHAHQTEHSTLNILPDNVTDNNVPRSLHHQDMTRTEESEQEIGKTR